MTNHGNGPDPFAGLAQAMTAIARDRRSARNDTPDGKRPPRNHAPERCTRAPASATGNER